MSTLMGNGRRVEFKELGPDYVEPPKETRSYNVVPYQTLAGMVETKCEKLLGSQYEMIDSEYMLARGDQHFFGLVTMKNSSTDMNLSVGYRNSYNKQLSVSLACGSQVIVCSNLMITGDVFVMRKNTTNAYLDLESLSTDAILSADTSFRKAKDIKFISEQIDMSNKSAYQMLGFLVGNGVIGTRQMKRALEEWDKPSYDHGINTAWTFYNAVTESLKSSQLSDKLVKLSDFNDMFVNEYLNKHPYFQGGIIN